MKRHKAASFNGVKKLSTGLWYRVNFSPHPSLDRTIQVSQIRGIVFNIMNWLENFDAASED